LSDLRGDQDVFVALRHTLLGLCERRDERLERARADDGSSPGGGSPAKELPAVASDLLFSSGHGTTPLFDDLVSAGLFACCQDAHQFVIRQERPLAHPVLAKAGARFVVPFSDRVNSLTTARSVR